jgi:hypothetical protein
VERRLPRLLEHQGERVHPLGLENPARQRPSLGHDEPRHDDLGLRRDQLLKTALQIAGGILIAFVILFVIAILIELAWF